MARPRPQAPLAAGQVWAYDFVFDSCANGQQLKCLTVIDEYTRESLAIDVAGSIRSARVVEVLSQLISVHGAPKILRSDNGPEFVSRALLRWAASQNLDMALIDPGKLDRDYLVEDAGSDGGLQWLRLKPKQGGDEAAFQSAKLGLDGKGLARMEIIDALGQRTEISFSGWKRNPAFARETFRYSPPAGVDVVGEG